MSSRDINKRYDWPTNMFLSYSGNFFVVGRLSGRFKCKYKQTQDLRARLLFTYNFFSIVLKDSEIDFWPLIITH